MGRMGLTRETVILEAIDLVVEEGYAALTISNLASRLGIKPASLYNHIEGLDDLAISVGNHAARILHDRIRREMEGETPEERIRSFAHSYRSFFLENPELAVAFTLAAHFDEPSVDQSRIMLDRVYNRLLEDFGLTWQQVIHCRRAIKGLMHGFCSQEIIQRDAHPLVWIDQSFDIAIDLFIAGLYALKEGNAPRAFEAPLYGATSYWTEAPAGELVGAEGGIGA